MSETPKELNGGNKIGTHIPHVILADAYAKDDAFMRKVSERGLEANPEFEKLVDVVAKINESPESPSMSTADGSEVTASINERSISSNHIRERAYFLWQSAARPDGCSDDFWYQAQLQENRERAYFLWESERRPDRKDVEYWCLVCAS